MLGPKAPATVAMREPLFKLMLPVPVLTPPKEKLPAASVSVFAPRARIPVAVAVVEELFVQLWAAVTLAAPRLTAEEPLLMVMPPVPPRVIVPLRVTPLVPVLPMIRPPAPEKVSPPVNVVRPAPVPSSVSVFAPPVTAPLTVKVLALPFVQLCEPPSVSGETIVTAAAAELIVMPALSVIA